MNLHEFIKENVRDRVIPEGEMLMQVLVIYRVVKTTEFDEDGDMPERVGCVPSAGCGAAMQRGMVTLIEEQWGYETAEDNLRDDDDDDSA